MRTQQEIQKEIDELIEQLTGYQKDFVKQYMTDYIKIYNKETDGIDFQEKYISLNYLNDAWNEFADGIISVYYADQLEYYRQNPTKCTEAFKSYGYRLEDFDDLELAVCKAGVCGWYDDIMEELTDGEKIKDLNNLIEELEDAEDGEE